MTARRDVGIASTNERSLIRGRRLRLEVVDLVGERILELGRLVGDLADRLRELELLVDLGRHAVVGVEVRRGCRNHHQRTHM